MNNVRLWSSVFFRSFLGHSPNWYKATVLCFLLINPLVLFSAGPFVAGWLLLSEFILTLALALKCYPLQPGGLLAMQALLLGLVDSETVYREISANLSVILLLVFMVAGIYFLRDLLLYLFSSILMKVRSRTTLSLLFCASAAVL
ncbi:MAG: sodium/proton antiporter, partial [Pseudomonadota bacterium]